MAIIGKTALVKDIATNLGFSQTAVSDVVQSLMDYVQEKTAAGDTVNLSGLGRFTVKDRAARMARNPHTGASVEVPASRVLTFKATKKA